MERIYTAAEVEARLSEELPRWSGDAGHIRRRYETHGWKGALMVVNAVGHLAEAAFHHPDLRVSYGWVEIRLTTHDAKGVTDKDFALAGKIEEVVLWRPGAEGGVLQGTPSDPRFAYIKYDD